jgi:hypothetical protein
MEEMEKQAVEFVLKAFAKDAAKWFYGLWSEFRERRAAFTVLDIPRPIRPLPKKSKKRRKKKSPSAAPPPSSAVSHGQFCPECGQEKR